MRASRGRTTAAGLAGLVTVRVSRSGATQRAGRAGREAPGAVYRCWSPPDHARLDPHPRPEITTADLTAFALELAVWGSPDGTDLALLDPPPPAALTVARQTLQALGAVDAAGGVTPRGRVVAGIAADPRLARALLDGAPLVGRRRAAEIVALLAEDVRAPGADLVAALRGLRAGAPGADGWGRATAALLRALPEGAVDAGARGDDRPRGSRDDRRDRPDRGSRPDAGSGPDAGSRSDRARPAAALGDDHAVGTVVALAHPDRIARLRPGGSTYLLTSGTGAALPPGSPLTGAPWLAVADADRGAGRRDATIRSAASLDEELALAAAPSLRREEDRVEWVDGRVVARRTTALGAIELASVPLTRPPAELVAEAVRAGLDRDGLDALPWTAAATALRRRLAFLRAALGPPWPDVSDDALRAGLAQWLGPELGRIRGAGDLRRIDVLAALRRLLPWPDAARLDELAPERVRVPSGSEVRVDYAGGPAGARGPAAGDLRVAQHSTPRWGPGAAARAPALARRASGRRDRGPRLLLANRLPAGAGRAPRPVPQARLAGRPHDRARHPRRPPTSASLRTGVCGGARGARTPAVFGGAASAWRSIDAVARASSCPHAPLPSLYREAWEAWMRRRGWCRL